MLSRIILESFKELAYSQVPKFSSVLHHCVVISKYLPQVRLSRRMTRH